MQQSVILKATTPTSRKQCSIHRNANTALSKHIQAQSEVQANSPQQDIVHLSVEAEESDIITDAGSERFRGVLSALITKPRCKELIVQGPWRDARPEAVKDSEAMGRAFNLEGEAGVRRVISRLERKTWRQQEMAGSDESWLEGLLLSQGQAGAKQERLIPPGEGWTRATDDMLWDSRSQVYFVQVGAQAGQYLKKDKGQFTEVDAPHVGLEYTVSVRAGGGHAVRRGAKMDRTVLLNELPKISRLALKFPLSFVDSPASAFAVFHGMRSPEAADFCARNYHTRLIPLLAAKIHHWETKELQDVLKKVLQELDSEIMKGPHAFSASVGAVALLLGNRLIISGVGQVRAVLLFEDGSTSQLLRCTSDFENAERERVEAAGGVIHGGLLHRTVDGLDEAERILDARHPFEVLQLEAGGPADEKQLRTAYRKLALRVHPDKAGEDVDKEAFNKAFSRLESAKEAVELMLSTDAESCRELHKVLRAEVHTRDGAAELYDLDKTAMTDTGPISEEAEKAAKKQIQRLSKMQNVSRDYAQAVAMCNEAVETLRRPCTPEALPRQEALLKMGVSSSRILGGRDLRVPMPIALMEPESVAWYVPTDKNVRLALLCGATAELPDQQLVSSTKRLRRQPKAAALRWCQDASSDASSVGALCIGFDVKRGRDDGPAKRQRTAVGTVSGQQAGSINVRHMLFRHQQLKGDPFVRRPGIAKNVGEAEVNALGVLERLVACPDLFPKLCKEHSDCQSADQPGKLVGSFGWLVRGQQEPAFDEAAFALEPNDLSDLVSTSRGVHIIQRLG